MAETVLNFSSAEGNNHSMHYYLGLEVHNDIGEVETF